MSDIELILDTLDFTPVCVCGHEMAEHAEDGCLEREPLKWACDCERYQPGVSE